MTKTNRFSLLGGALLLAASLGAPNACLDINQTDKSPNQTGDGTWANPLRVRRDNLAMGGMLDVKDTGVKSSVTSPYLSDGKWTRLTGHFTIDELRDHYWHYAYQSTPILPRETATGATTYDYGTRAGYMVKGNTYAVSIKGKTTGGDQFDMKNVQYVKLADDVLVVPVVVASWKLPGADPKFVNQYWRSNTMFDFSPVRIDNQAAPTPYWKTNNTPGVKPQPLQEQGYLLANEIDSPTSFFTTNPPNRDEVPPDDIWAQCGIQFQVVKQLIVEHKAGWYNHCSVNSLNFGDPENAPVGGLSAELASNPYLQKAFRDLQPVVVSYGDNSDCHSFGGFIGTTPGKGRFIEIDNQRPTTETSHELGHALGLDHLEVNGSPVAGNLMRVNPSGEKNLTAAQCTAARAMAKQFSDRYDYFNFVTGRTFSDQDAPPLSSGGGDLGDFDPSGGGSNGDVCCLQNGAVSETAAGACAGTSLAIEMCQQVCCSNGQKETEYACTQQGATGNVCPPA